MSSVKPPSNWASFTAADLLVYVLILGLGALPFFFYEKAPDFINEDVGYFDLAQSLLYHHSYSANFVPERVQPPGLPTILAAVCVTLGCTHDTLLRTMPVFLTLGLLLSYEVLRRQRGRLIAAASCLLLASSPDIFPWVTSRLWPSFPYLLTSMLILLLTPKLETSQRGVRRVLAVVLLCLLVAAAVIIESAGIALIGAMLAWLILSFFGNLEIARLRLKLFLPIVLFALLAEVLWLQQGSNPRDWPLPGRGESYLAQLSLKSGHYPELGQATPKDIVLRVVNNLKESMTLFGKMLLQRWISPSWTSPVIVGLLVLVVSGLWSSLWRSNSQLCALYFICYECIYLLWPWVSGLVRFGLAVLPLACLYLAEGVLAIQRWSREHPRRVGAVFLPVSILLAFFARDGWAGGTSHSFQDRMSAVFWVICTVLCVSLIWKQSLPSWIGLSWAQKFFGNLSFRPAQLFVVLAVTYLVATGAAANISMGRQNLASGVTTFENSPEIQAARWIKSHTAPNVILASRQVALIYHYSRRKVIWFPPITAPEVLMQGLREKHVDYLIVVDRRFSYYLPPETVCFDLLDKAYASAFRLVEEKGPLKIYEALPYSPDSAAKGAN